MAPVTDIPATDEQPVNILLVDDRPDKMLSLEAMLASLGQNLVQAHSGDEALRRLLHQDFAVILLDVNMPGLDGFDTAALIRKRRSSEKTPIIFVTAFAETETHVSRGYSLGAVDYIQLPIEPEILRAKVAVFVDLFNKTEQAKQHAETEAAERRAAFLADLSSALAESLDFGTTLTKVAHVAVPRIADWCLLDVFSEDGGYGRLEVVHPADASAEVVSALRAAPSPRNGGTPIERVLRDAAPVLLHDAAGGEILMLAADTSQKDALRILSPSSVIIVPLVIRERVLGVLTLLRARERHRYGKSELGLAEEMGRRASLAIENAWLYRESQEARRIAEAANRAKDEFLATLSHELRTPLSPILGWTLMLRGEQLDAPSAKRALEVIERNVRAQVQLIEDLLDVSRIITGKLQLDLHPITDLASVVEAGIEVVRPAADAQELTIEAALDRSPGTVSGDAGRIQQIVWNLVSNAVKFTGRRGHVRVELRRAGDEAQILVTDTGKGIAPEFLPHVFERFRQADSSSTRSQGGLGLGLAIVRHLVELHGGKVEARSEGQGKGATFVVSLPIQRAAEGPAVAAAPTPAVVDVQLDGLRVLVVDDEIDMRELLTFSLSQYGASVVTAGSAGEALAEIDRQVPDVLVSDIGMPEEDGYWLIEHVRARPPGQGGDVPAAALTAYAKDQDGDRALQAGFQTYLTKPVDPDLLVSAVAELARRVAAPHTT